MPVIRYRGVAPQSIVEGSGPSDWVANLHLSGDVSRLAAIETTGPMAAFFVGVSSGFPYAMIGATLPTRLARDGIDKKAVTAFTLGHSVTLALSASPAEFTALVAAETLSVRMRS